MRRNHVSAVVTFALLLGGASAAPPAATTRSAGRRTVTLSQRLVPGSYVMTQTMKMQQQVHAGGAEPQTQRISQTVVSTRQVRRPDAEGKRQVVLAFRRIQQRIEAGAKVKSYDSAGPPADQDPTLAAIFLALMPVKILATVADDGTVLASSGMETMWDTVAGKAPVAAPILQKVKTAMTAGLVEALLTKWGEILPAHPVAVGDQWQAEMKFEIVPFGTELSYEHNCKLKELRRGPDGPVAVIEFTGRAQRDQEISTELRGSTLTASGLTFRLTGQMQMDVRTGMIVDKTVRQNGQMSLSVPGPGRRVVQMQLKQQWDTHDVLRREGPASQPATGPAGP